MASANLCKASRALKWRIGLPYDRRTKSVPISSPTLHRFENMGCNGNLALVQPVELRVATNIAHMANEGTIRPF